MHAHTKNKNVKKINEILSFIEKDTFTIKEWIHACYMAGYNDKRTIVKYLNVAIALGLLSEIGYMSFRKTKS
jgi:hypothetical protein